MATIQDYFKGTPVISYVGESEADFRAQCDIDEIAAQLDRFLDWQDCKQDGEWYYAHQCGGLHASPKGYCDWDALRPVPMTAHDLQMWCDYDIRNAWMRHYWHLQGLADMLERYQDMCYDIDFVEGASDEALYEAWYRLDSLTSRIADLYGDAFDEAIQDVCHAAQRLMRESCDYAYSAEAALEWLEYQDDEDDEDDVAAIVNDAAAEILAGLTAAYEGYAA